MAFQTTRNQNVAEDGYGASEDEDDCYYYDKFFRRRVAVLDNITGKRNHKKKRRKWGNTNFEEKESHFQENLPDPFVVVGWDIMLIILGHLDARSVALSLLVSRSWHGVASSDDLWSKKTQQPYIKQFSSPYLLLVGGLMDDTQENIKKGNSAS